MLVVQKWVEVLRQKSTSKACDRNALSANPPEVDGLGETMAELAVPRGNFARRALFQLSPLGAIIVM